jgi:hypothetical protein
VEQHRPGDGLISHPTHALVSGWGCRPVTRQNYVCLQTHTSLHRRDELNSTLAIAVSNNRLQSVAGDVNWATINLL